jgi:hypothetical protein
MSGAMRPEATLRRPLYPEASAGSRGRDLFTEPTIYAMIPEAGPYSVLLLPEAVIRCPTQSNNPISRGMFRPTFFPRQVWGQHRCRSKGVHDSAARRIYLIASRAVGNPNIPVA